MDTDSKESVYGFGGTYEIWGTYVKICVSFNDSVIAIRYFTDSGIIGTKAFVAAQYQHFKNLFPSKSDRTPKPVTGLTGMFSLKRLGSPFPLK